LDEGRSVVVDNTNIQVCICICIHNKSVCPSLFRTTTPLNFAFSNIHTPNPEKNRPGSPGPTSGTP
jgi:hypothetical protein